MLHKTDVGAWAMCCNLLFFSLASGDDDRVAWYKIHLAECLKHFKSAADLNRAVVRAQEESVGISKNASKPPSFVEHRCLRDMIDRSPPL